MPRVLSSVVSVQVFPRGQEHRLRLRSSAFRTWLWTKTEIEKERERENLETGRNSTESLLQCPQLASFTVPSSGIPATKGMESDSEEKGGRFPFYVLSILILGLVFANQERGEGMRIPRVVGSTVGVLAAKLEILTCEF